MIRGFPRANFLIIDFSVMRNGGVNLAELMVHKALHEEAGLQIEGLPVLRVSRELVSVEKGNQSLALLPPFHVFVFRRLSCGTVAVDASVLFVKAIAQGMIDERQAGAANGGVLLPSHALGRFYNQPTGLQIQTILGFFGIALAIRHAPIIMEVIPAIADIGIDDLIREQIQ